MESVWINNGGLSSTEITFKNNHSIRFLIQDLAINRLKWHGKFENFTRIFYDKLNQDDKELYEKLFVINQRVEKFEKKMQLSMSIDSQNSNNEYMESVNDPEQIQDLKEINKFNKI